MPAIVLNDEDTHEQQAGRQGKRQAQNGKVRVDEIHRRAGDDERTEGRQELQHSSASDRLCESRSGPSHLDARAIRRSVGIHEAVLCVAGSTMMSMSSI